jgi:regulator of cell morphogenesis and NO signaling
MNDTTVTKYYQDDHDRLEVLLGQFQALKRTDFKSAKPFFREFKFGLQRHIIWEEEILFPVFEQKAGNTAGPTQVMRIEHQQILAALEQIHAKVKIADPECDAEEQMLLRLLAVHNKKEEMILYPAIDRSIDTAERTGVFAEMAKLPAERYAVCCGHK